MLLLNDNIFDLKTLHLINFNPNSKGMPDLRTCQDQDKCSAAGATQNNLDRTSNRAFLWLNGLN